MLTTKDIIKEGNPTLRKVAEVVPLPASEEDQQILASLMEYVQNSQNIELVQQYDLRPGIGLSCSTNKCVQTYDCCSFKR